MFQNQWWKGPDWLFGDRDSWPCSEVIYNFEEINKEMRKVVSTNLVSDKEDSTEIFGYFSVYNKVVRLVG